MSDRRQATPVRADRQRRGRRAGLCLVGVASLLATVLAADQLDPTAGDRGGATWSVTVGSATSGYCVPSDDPGRCEVVVPVEPMDPEERCYVDPGGNLAEPADVEACLQRLVDDGAIGADVLAELRCTVAYEALPAEVSDDEYARAGEAFQQCMVAAATAPGPSPSTTAVGPTG
jgi:hypothetical protein